MREFIATVLLATLLVSASAQSKPLTPKASIAAGKLVYEQYCLPCHQIDGSGVPNMNPPLIKTSFVLGDPKKLVKILINGLNEEIEIDGNTYSNPMPPFGSILTDDEIANVLTYVRNSFGNKAAAVIPAVVKAGRTSK